MAILVTVSKAELIDLIDGLMDGIDGYECEVGYTDRYWKPQVIRQARKVLFIAEKMKEREERKQREGRSKGRKE